AKAGGEGGVVGIGVVHAVAEIELNVGEVGSLGRGFAAEGIGLGERGGADEAEGGKLFGANQQEYGGRNVVGAGTVGSEGLSGGIAGSGEVGLANRIGGRTRGRKSAVVGVGIGEHGVADFAQVVLAFEASGSLARRQKHGYQDSDQHPDDGDDDQELDEDGG